MKVSTITFPSVFESAFGNTENSSRDLLNGLKIKNENIWYLAGNLAKRGGINPNKVVNASPQEEDYEVLFKAALITVAETIQQPMFVTVGFPFSTYNVYKEAAERFLARKNFLVEYDTQTFHNRGAVKKALFDIERFDVIPEIVGGIIGLKKVLGPQQPKSFIAISLGFGTIEGAMATADGLVQRTVFSSHGLRYAINNLTRELNKKYYLEMKNEHQLDDAFVKGFIFINRKNIDLKQLRKEILHQYYKEIISPLFKRYFTDSDFENCEKIYLLGGGAFYTELQEAFQEEFKDVMPVEIAPDADKLASIGDLYNSLRISDEKFESAIGIDLGNATTIVSTFENEKR